MASSSSGSRESMFLVNHVFLPPKLPQESDSNGQFDQLIAKEVLNALSAFRLAQDAGSPDTNLAAIDVAIRAMARLVKVHQFSPFQENATIDAERLQTQLTQLTKSSKCF